MADDITSEESEYLEATFIFLVAGLSIFTAHLFEKYQIHWLPESGAIIIIGSIFGFIGWITDSVQVEAASTFSVDVFELVFLPAIIFESGFSLKKRGMFANFRPILLLAIVGTAVSTIITSLGIIFICTPNGIGGLSQIEALLFGSLISATDPVATLSIFSSVFEMDQQTDQDDGPLLYNIVFGESVLNDAVAIVLFTTFEGFTNDVTMDGPTIAQIIWTFTYTAFLSVLIGVSFGLFSAVLTKWTMIRENPKFDLVLLYMLAYGSYFLAAAFSLSGLFAIFFCGITMGHYTWYNLSAFSQLSSPIFFKMIANISEMLVFCFLGMGLFGSDAARQAWSASFTVMVFLFMCVGRALHVFPICWISNLGRQRKITFKEQFAILYSGLRGALAFALSLKTSGLGLEHSDEIISTTLTIAMFTTLFQGTTTRPLLKWLGITAEKHDEHPDESASINVNKDGYQPVDDGSRVRHRTPLNKLDITIFRPFFLANPEIAGGSTKQAFNELANGLTKLTYRNKLDTHKAQLWDLLLKFSAQDQQESKKKIQEQYDRKNSSLPDNKQPLLQQVASDSFVDEKEKSKEKSSKARGIPTYESNYEAETMKLDRPKTQSSAFAVDS